MPPEIVPLFLFLFCAVFQTLGAAFIGLGVRAMLNGETGNGGQILFGAIFAGAGTLFSFAMTREFNAWGFPIGVMWTFLVILGTIFTPQEILARFGASVTTIALGSFAALVGGAVLIGTIRAQEEILFGILFGGCWSVVGWSLALTGIGALLRGKPLRFKRKRAGEYEIVPADQAEKPPAAPARAHKKY